MSVTRHADMNKNLTSMLYLPLGDRKNQSVNVTNEDK
jgi:hypothetical protein